MLDEDISRFKKGMKRIKMTVAMRALPNSSKRREAEVRTPFIHAFHVALSFPATEQL
jgi:hypothetical protein